MVVMVKRQKKTGSKKKRNLIIAGVAVAVLAIGGGTFYYFQHRNQPITYKKTSTGHDVNLNPPTKEEKKETQENKSDSVTKEQEMASKNDAGTPVTNTKSPFITYASQEGANVQVNGYVTGVFEDGGTCTATFAKGSQKVTGTSKGIADADHTTCPPITIPRANFPATGTWSVILSYSSSAGNGASEARNVTIQ
jgi:hypothetical protein